MANDGLPGPDGGAGGAPPPASWMDGLTPELKQAVESKGYKSPTDVVQAYVNAEKLIGVDKIAVPKDGVFDAQSRAKLGVPDAPDKYAFTKPTLPDGMAWDDSFQQTALAKAHELGLTPKQVQGLMEVYAAKASGDFGSMNAASEQARESTAEALKQEWGAGYQAKLENAARAARMIGGDALIEALETSGAGNNVEIVRAFSKIGAMLAEDRLKSGQPSGFNMTPEEARNEANKLMLTEAYRDSRHLEHSAVVQKVQSLFRQAYPEG